MTTPQQVRLTRIENDYKQMLNIQRGMIDWRILEGRPPHVEEYELMVRVRTIIGPGPEYRDRHTIRVSLPPYYPYVPPVISMVSRPKPLHPNWYSTANWCYGTWVISEGLGQHVIRMIRTLQFDREITDPGSAAD